MNNKQLSVIKRNSCIGSDKLQTLLLVLTTVTITFTLGKSFLHLETQSPQFAHYQFPEAIAFRWNFFSSRSINSNFTQSFSGEFVSGKQYIYQQNGKYLEIEMRYVVDTDGNLKSFITNRTGELSPSVRQDGAGGFYSVYVDSDKVNLSACINPNGGSTVKSDRFRRNRILHDNHLTRIVPWLRGQKELLDKRCLWAHLSIPLDRNVSLDEQYRILETAWFDWYEYWQINYPEARSSR